MQSAVAQALVVHPQVAALHDLAETHSSYVWQYFQPKTLCPLCSSTGPCRKKNSIDLCKQCCTPPVVLTVLSTLYQSG